MASSRSGGLVKNTYKFKAPEFTDADAEELWSGLEKGLLGIQNGNASAISYEVLYRYSYKLVLHKRGRYVYNGVQRIVSSQLERLYLDPRLRQPDQCLEALVALWRRHTQDTSMIRDVLIYLDRAFTDPQGVPSVYDMGLTLFKQVVLLGGSREVLEAVQGAFLATIAADREGRGADRMLLRNVVEMMIRCNLGRLQIYEAHVEAPFLAATQPFCADFRDEFIGKVPVPVYVRRVTRLLRVEEDRCLHVFSSGTFGKLRAVLHEALVASCAETLLADVETGPAAMILGNRFKEFRALYQLLKRVPATLPRLAETVQRLLVRLGHDAVEMHKGDNSVAPLIQRFIELRGLFRRLVTESCLEDKSVERTVKEGFELLLNSNLKLAKDLAAYVDHLVRRGVRQTTREEVLLQMEEVLELFRFLNDKDVFEDFYKHQLAARLMGSGGSASDDVELHFIALLKQECGHQFTTKLDCMFRDVALSVDIEKTFRASAGASAPSAASSAGAAGPTPYEIHPKVLTAGTWPFVPPPDALLPVAVRGLADRFSTFYSGSRAGRKLQWHVGLGNADVMASFPRGRRSLAVTTMQMLILTLFNHKRRYTLQEICEQLQVGVDDLDRHLLSLAHPKVRILNKRPNSRNLAGDHQFEVNMEYHSKLFRLKVPLIQPRKTDVDKDAKTVIPARVLEARNNRVEAAIVRVMKARRRMPYVDLVAEVSRQLAARFPTTSSFVKKRVEGLMDRQYLERDAQDRTFLLYLA